MININSNIQIIQQNECDSRDSQFDATARDAGSAARRRQG